jgi:hypothetical protein
MVMDKILDHILLVSAHDYAAHGRVIWLGPEVSRVRGVTAVFEGNKMVFLITSHVVGMRHAAGRIDLARVLVDDLRRWLMDSVPVFPELFHFQLVRVCGWRPNLLRAPLAVADVVLDVRLGDLRIRCPQSPNWVRLEMSAGPMRLDGVGGTCARRVQTKATGMVKGIRIFIWLAPQGAKRGYFHFCSAKVLHQK